MCSVSFSSKNNTALILVLCLAGLGISAWLTTIHVKVHLDPAYVSVCAVSEKINCETVAASAYSVFWGLPVSVWGMAAYLVLLGFTAGGYRKPGMAGTLALFSVFMAICSLLLAYVSFVTIKAVCLLCTAVYVINILLAVVAVKTAMGHKRVGRFWPIQIETFKEMPWPAAGAVVLLALLILAGPGRIFPRYWELASWQDGPVLPSGFDDQGHPWLGALEPKLVVEEYFDYECPHCRVAHRKLRRLLSNNADKMRIVRYDYGRMQCIFKEKYKATRCTMVRAGFCFSRKDRFWEWNDTVLARPKPTYGPKRRTYEADTAAELGLERSNFDTCLEGKDAFEYAERRYQETVGNKIRTTPAYRVDGKRVTLAQLADIIDNRLE